jgi:hypothetical protein
MQKQLSAKYAIQNDGKDHVGRYASHKVTSGCGERHDFYTSLNPETDIVVEATSPLDENEVNEKFDFRKETSTQEFLVSAPYGSIRLDKVNGTKGSRLNSSESPHAFLESSGMKNYVPWANEPPCKESQQTSQIQDMNSPEKMTENILEDHQRPFIMAETHSSEGNSNDVTHDPSIHGNSHYIDEPSSSTASMKSE